ncbi:integrator complex subunit 6-like [Trichechus inunguis]
MDEADEFATGPADDVKRPGECDSPPSSKKRRSEAVLSVEPEGETGCHLEGSAMPKEDDATVVHDCHEEGVENGQTAPDGFLSKSVPPELMSMAGDGIPPNKVDSPSDDLARLGEGGVIREPGSSALGGGTGSSSLSAGGPKVTAMSALGTVQISSQRNNDDIKHELMKEVRKFGRKYERIFILLEEVQGPLEVKKQFVEFTIKEAARFKRRDLIQHLEKLLEKIDSDSLVNKDENIKNI